MKASIVIPTRNEKKNLTVLLSSMKKLHGNKYEVLVVDDSTDGTHEVPGKFGYKVIRNKVRKGKGYAMRVGFENAKNDIIVVMDADLSHKPEDIPKLLEPFKNKKVGVVIGSRILGGSDEYTFFRALGNILITGSFNMFFGTSLFDSVNGFKAMRKKVTKGLKVDGFDIEFEILSKCLTKGHTIEEVASHEQSRRFEEPKFNAFVNGMEFFKRIVIEAVKYRTN